jgi:hypothetical protein
MTVKHKVDELLKLGVPKEVVQPILDFDEIRRLREENEELRAALIEHKGWTIDDERVMTVLRGAERLRIKYTKLRKVVEAAQQVVDDAEAGKGVNIFPIWEALRELDEAEK